MGSNIIRMGKNGMGLVMKICHNTLVAQIQNGVNETLALARLEGISVDDFALAISYGGGQNSISTVRRRTSKTRTGRPRSRSKICTRISESARD